MGKLVKVVGRDIYIYADRQVLYMLEDWYLKIVHYDPHFDDPPFEMIDPFIAYPNIWRITGVKHYNIQRLASQIGSTLAKNAYVDKTLRVRRPK